MLGICLREKGRDSPGSPERGSLSHISVVSDNRPPEASQGTVYYPEGTYKVLAITKAVSLVVPAVERSPKHLAGKYPEDARKNAKDHQKCAHT